MPTDTSTGASFWARLAARTVPSGVAATIEHPRTLVRVTTATLFGAAANAALTAGVLAWFDEPTASVFAAAVGAAYLGTWLWYAVTGSIRQMAMLGIAFSTLEMFAVHVALGGFANSGAHVAWAITQVVVAALMFSRRTTLAVTGFFVVAMVVLAALEPTLAASRPPPDPMLPTLLVAFVIVGNVLILGILLISLLSRLAQERARAEGLLLNVLPAAVAAELKEHGETKAERFDSISVLFADIVGFTPLAASLEPEDMVDRLNDVFSRFDDLAERYGCEKIRTIGDGYMVAAGLPTPRPDHAEALASMAIAMLASETTGPLQFRIGINTGPAVAGVIGTSKFQYDVWGDTVNTASRMESHGEPGRIHVTDAVRRSLGDRWRFEARGPIEVKGKGVMETYFLLGRA